MAMPKTEFDIATKLVSASLGTIGTSLFHCPELAPDTVIPTQAIFVASYSSPAPQPYFASSNNKNFYRKMVQVVVRANPGDYENGITRARAVITALHLATVTDSVNSGSYMKVAVLQSEPNFLGQNDMECPRWTINVELWLVY